MVRRKGERTKRQVDELYPHQVQLLVPRQGLRGAWWIMYRWANQHDYAERTATPKKDTSRHFIRWCFKSAEVADAFVTDFGGERITVPGRPQGLRR